MSGVLLDTHVLIWSLFDRPELTSSARRHIDPARPIYVSVVSIYEIDFKRARAGARSADGFLRAMPRDLPAALPGLGLTLVPLDARTARAAAILPIDHGDPWDRILVAQALALDAPLLSADTRLRAATEAHPDTAGVVVF